MGYFKIENVLKKTDGCFSRSPLVWYTSYCMWLTGNNWENRSSLLFIQIKRIQCSEQRSEQKHTVHVHVSVHLAEEECLNLAKTQNMLTLSYSLHWHCMFDLMYPEHGIQDLQPRIFFQVKSISVVYRW